MSSMIIYSSKAGNTKKIAEAMATAIGVAAVSADEMPAISSVDTLFIGSGIYAGKVAPSIEAFVAGLDKASAPKVVLFSTSMSGVSQLAKLRQKLVEKGIDVIEKEFNCKGKFLIFCRNHPDAADLASASQFAKNFS